LEQSPLLLQAEHQFEELIQGLLIQEYGLCTSFLDHALLTGLRQNLLTFHREGLMHPAGVGRKFDYQRNAEIRGDVIRWIDQHSSDPFERMLMDKVAAFIQYLNSSCYTGINDWEFHYAYYEPGSFYRRHLDQFKSDWGRQYSFVLYLNEDWQETDGGQIGLYTSQGLKKVLPIGGQAVFFKSDELEHEVMIAPERSRMSIAGWLKRV
jgi:SM-20-related protein